MLEVARLAAQHEHPVAFLGFNCEEDGLLGSREFVRSFSPALKAWVSQVHVLEMVGFSTSEPGSQRFPVPFIPGAPDAGDFIGIVADHRSVSIANQVLRTTRKCPGGPRVVALKTYFGMHRLLPDLSRSDHSPFWEVGIPSLMWTDTAEFRNPNYHAPTDTPDTLDYEFMASVVRLLHASLTPTRVSA